MLLEELGDRLGVRDMALDAQAERFEALQEEEGVEGGEAAAEVAQDLDAGLDDEGRQAGGEQVGVDQAVVGVIRGVEVGEARVVLPGEVAAVDDHAADGGAVPADELGGGVDDDVGAALEGAEEVGGGEGVVDHDGDAEFLADFGDLLEGEDVDQRVAEGLAVEDLGVGADGAAEVLGVGGVDEGDVDTQAGEGVDELVVGAAVEGGGGDDVVAGAGEGEDGLGLGGVTGGGGQGADAAFQIGDALLEDIGGGVHDAGVDIAEFFEGEQVGGVLGACGTGRRWSGRWARRAHRWWGRATWPACSWRVVKPYWRVMIELLRIICPGRRGFPDTRNSSASWRTTGWNARASAPQGGGWGHHPGSNCPEREWAAPGGTSRSYSLLRVSGSYSE